MGNDGRFTRTAYTTLRADRGYSTMNTNQIFTNRTLMPEMNPHGIDVRESRDSNMHPESLAIMVFVDQTGSMRTIPTRFVKDDNGMPELVGLMLDAGIPNPQVCFGAIGDHTTGEDAPIQLGQFESSAERMDKWLTGCYMVGQGGGSNEESYLLAWYSAWKHTSIDCFEKRNQKGFLFTIGDESTHEKLTPVQIERLFGYNPEREFTAKECLEGAQEKYNVYHIHVKEGAKGNDPTIINAWRELMGQNLIIVDDYTTIAKTIGNMVAVAMDASPLMPTEGGFALDYPTLEEEE